MTMPNFLVIGAAKCGTDSLCNYLGQHPDVYISPKREPNFFLAEGITEVPYRGPGDRAALEPEMWTYTLEQYQSLFSGVTSEKAVGEGTTWYIYFKDVPLRIRQHIPQAKLVAVLRNPVDRAYSAYTMLLGQGRETIGDFAQALAAEEFRTRRNWEPIWHYAKMGFYTRQLQRYYETFDRSQIRVIVYDDYDSKPMEVVSETFRFLEVDDRFSPDVKTRYNVSRVPKHLAMHSFVAGQHLVKTALKTFVPVGIRQAAKRHVVSRNLTRPAPMVPEVRRQLVETFRPDILELEKVIDRDLSHWLR